MHEGGSANADTGGKGKKGKSGRGPRGSVGGKYLVDTVKAEAVRAASALLAHADWLAKSGRNFRWDVRLPASAFRRRGASDVFGVAIIDHTHRTHRSEDAVYAPRYRAPGR